MLKHLIKKPLNLLNNNKKQYFSNGVDAWDVMHFKREIENIRFWCMSTTIVNVLILIFK